MNIKVSKFSKTTNNAFRRYGSLQLFGIPDDEQRPETQ
jgi:hypothetical protein